MRAARKLFGRSIPRTAEVFYRAGAVAVFIPVPEGAGAWEVHVVSRADADRPGVMRAFRDFMRIWRLRHPGPDLYAPIERCNAPARMLAGALGFSRFVAGVMSWPDGTTRDTVVFRQEGAR